MRPLPLLAPLALVLLGGLMSVAGASAQPSTVSGAAAQPRRPAETPLEVELLLRLDLLRETDLKKQRELYPKMSLFERLRLLEQLGWLEGEPEATPIRNGGDKR